MNKLLILSMIVLCCGVSYDVPPSKPQFKHSHPTAITFDCPKIHVTCSDPFDENAPLQFQVRVEGGDPNKKLKYSWFVSRGHVKSGQGTTSIIVDATGDERKGLTATVVICGLPYECENEASCTTMIASRN